MTTVVHPIAHPVEKVKAKVTPKPARFDYERQWRTLQGFLLILDAIVVYFSLTTAYTIRISSGLLAYSSPYDPVAYHRFTLWSVLIWLVLFLAMGLYRRDTLLGGLAEYQGVARGCMTGLIVIVSVSFLWRDTVSPSRGWLLLSWGFLCVLLCIERFLVRRIAYALRRRGWLSASVLIVGANDQGTAIAQQWLRSPTSGMVVAGFIDDFKPVGTTVIDGLQVLGRPSALDTIARETGAREVVVITSAVAWETFEEIITRAGSRSGYTVRLSPGFYELLATGVAVTTKTFVPLFTVNEGRLVGVDAVLKRVLDYGLAVTFAVLFSPLMALTAFWLRINRPQEPVLNRYPTGGQCGSVFTMYKFHFKASDQPVSSAGGSSRSWLERALIGSRLDKLPQLFNVLAGHMSVVGPRPRLVSEQQSKGPSSHNLQTVKPGVIGPWIVTGSLTSGDEVQDELHYIRSWTIWLDLQILLQATITLLYSLWRETVQGDPERDAKHVGRTG